MAPLTIQHYVHVARRPAFRRFWLGMMISRAGDAFTTVAVSWVVLDIAGPLQLGVVLLCFGLPRVVSGPIAGHVLDRTGRTGRPCSTPPSASISRTPMCSR